MANSDKRIVYTDEEGRLIIMCPASYERCGLTVEEIQTKDVPEGITSHIVNLTDLPSDPSFTDAWTYTPD